MVRRILASLSLSRSLALAIAFAFCAVLSPRAVAQTTGDSIDLYFGDWHTSTPRTIRGSLQEQDILTRGNPQNPTQKGAVLRSVNSYTYATLASHASARATRLDGQQEIYFVQSGQGTATEAGQTADLLPNIAVLMPANLEFTIKNTGDRPLAMYVINEPTPPGFRPNSSMLARDENKLPITSSDGHWAHIVKTLFVTEDGLGTLQSVLTVTLDPLTIGKPHVVDHDDIEEVWTALDGTSLAFIGNQLRRQTPGMSFYHIPDNKTPHTNINQNEGTQVMRVPVRRILYSERSEPGALNRRVVPAGTLAIRTGFIDCDRTIGFNGAHVKLRWRPGEFGLGKVRRPGTSKTAGGYPRGVNRQRGG
jgi:mannose-6-phosphate isomerase-like protein (cupin superfamily)